MMPPRGGSGQAPPPPKNLRARKLPIATIDAGTPFFRVHRTAHDPIFFGPGEGRSPTYRFDPQSGRFGVLYCAPDPDAALIETLLRNPQRLTVDYREIATRSLSRLSANRALKLVVATGQNLSRLGTTAALSTGPYAPCGQWADALFDHPQAPDGILYASRHNPDERCLALFDRADIRLSVIDTDPLARMLGRVGALLDRHGKSLFGAP